MGGGCGGGGAGEGRAFSGDASALLLPPRGLSAQTAGMDSIIWQVNQGRLVIKHQASNQQLLCYLEKVNIDVIKNNNCLFEWRNNNINMSKTIFIRKVKSVKKKKQLSPFYPKIKLHIFHNALYLTKNRHFPMYNGTRIIIIYS